MSVILTGNDLSFEQLRAVALQHEICLFASRSIERMKSLSCRGRQTRRLRRNRLRHQHRIRQTRFVRISPEQVAQLQV